MSQATSYSTRTRRRPSSNGRRNNFKSNHSSYAKNSHSRPKRRGQRIDPARFIKSAKPIIEHQYQPENSFDDFLIDDQIKQNLRIRKFSMPTQIQDQSIPLGLEGKDVIGIANTGTGKTIAFLLPLLTKIIHDKTQKALIIAPTRELAIQIQQEARWLAKGSRLYDALLIGGSPIGRQFHDLRQNPEIIVGTPGRIKDHLERNSLRLDDVSTIVLDEVDRMLDMGFITDIRLILSKLSSSKQSMFFSATMSPTIENLIRSFTQSPTTIMAKTAETSDNVEQSIVNYGADGERIIKLHDLLISDQFQKTLIFCETKRSTERLSKELISRGFAADAMHGNKSQGQRQRALRKFKSSEINVLVATDVAARGIDVDNISHVINYDIPQTYDDYTHRIGRTGRGNNVGNAITFVAY